MRKVELDSQTINNFFSDEDRRRMIREGRVKELMTMLKNGKHFSAIFVINTRDGRNRLIDGNHRYDAIKRIMAENPDFSIDVWVAEYKNLTDIEEKEVFSHWNSGLKQSTDDFLKLHWENFPFGDDFLRRVPASIYGQPNRIKARLIGGAHIESKKAGSFSGGYSADGFKAIADMASIDREDIRLMGAFMRDMEQVIGSFNPKEVFWKSTAVQAFYKVWYDNRALPREKFLKAFRQVFMGSASITWRTSAKQSGREATKAFYYAAISALKARQPLFVSTNGNNEAEG